MAWYGTVLPPHINDISVCLCYSISFFRHVKYLKGKPNLYQELSTQPCEHHRPKFRSCFKTSQIFKVFRFVKKKSSKKVQVLRSQGFKTFYNSLSELCFNGKNLHATTFHPWEAKKICINKQGQHFFITMVLPVLHPRLIPPIALHTSRERYLVTPRWWKKNWPFGGGSDTTRPRDQDQDSKNLWCGKTEFSKSDDEPLIFWNPNFKVKSNMPRQCKSEKCQKVQGEIAKPCETIFRQLSKAE